MIYYSQSYKFYLQYTRSTAAVTMKDTSSSNTRKTPAFSSYPRYNNTKITNEINCQ